jgi:Fe-S-cluster containining protein
VDVVTDLDEIRRRAAQRHDEFEVMRYMLELNDDLSDADLDSLVDAVAAPIIAAIDCTRCANCCRSLDVALTPDDAGRLAEGINVPLDAILTRYADHKRGQTLDEWAVIRGKPCPFLTGTRCSVYAHRPDTCRLYPEFTPDFRWTLEHTIEGAGLCPIIYNVLSAMVVVMDNLDRPEPPAAP